MRIIAGTLRGHRLRCKPGGSLRPTGDRMRESLFSALGSLVRDAAVCDLFAGSGALGFESLSRGAEHTTFVENKRKLADTIAGTADQWDLSARCSVVCADAFAYLAGLDGNPFDLVFADPPFAANLAPRVFQWWAATAAESAVLVLELPAGSDGPGDGNGIAPAKHAVFGDSSYRIYQQG